MPTPALARTGRDWSTRPGAVVASAQNADLLYLQHIVIPTRPLAHPAAPDQPDVPTATDTQPPPRHHSPRRALHRIGHADLLVFARPAGATPLPPPAPASRPTPRHRHRHRHRHGEPRGRLRDVARRRVPVVTGEPRRSRPLEPVRAAAADPTVPAAALPVSVGETSSVWATGQASPAVQRRGRYVPESSAHPAKMLPAVAAHAITHYTRPGELVLDPMCGIGTTLVEAVHLGRRAVGVEYETRWAQIARANLDLAGPGRAGAGQVITGDARHLDWLLPPQLLGQVALIVTSPPYGPSTHGQVDTGPGGIHKRDHLYGNVLDRGNLANIGHHRLLAGFTRILTLAARYLRPGGHVVITVRPWREHAELIDLPAQITACGRHAGLTPVERCVALLGRVTDHGGYVARGSFFQRDFIRRQRDRGLPLHVIAHEDVIVLQQPAVSRSSRDRPTASAALRGGAA